MTLPHASRRGNGRPTNRLGAAIQRVLPTGDTLPHENWARRHSKICLLLWAHAIVIPVLALASGAAPAHALAEGAVVALFALIASNQRLSRNAAASLATLGLVTCSAILTHLSGGLIEMHFHFFVVVVIISMYQSWIPFLLTLAYVVFHHGVFGAVFPESVFNHPAAIDDPLTWTLVHSGFILAQSAACLAIWRSNEDALSSERTARAVAQRANAELAEAQAISNVGSWDWDLATGSVWWSKELYKITGLNPGSFTPSVDGFLALVHEEDRSRVGTILEAASTNRSRLDYECRITRSDDVTRVVHCLGRAVVEDGTLVKVLGTCQDITERKALEQEVEHRAFHDTLTGLGNRALLQDRIEHALERSKRSNAPLTLLYLDLDEFKNVNDTLGHAFGDQLLIEVANRLLAAVRAADTVARLGGDEFAVLLENTDVPGAQEIAERIETSLHLPISLQGRQLNVGTSIGIASAAANKGTDLLRDADIAMYAAKRDGKGTHRVFSQSMLSSVVNRLELRSELSGAIERGEFVVHYQPVVDLRTRKIESVEALVRWMHPQRGIIPPTEFIPLAEETGLVVPLGAWVLKTATREIRALQHEIGVPLSVTVNLSPQQLTADVTATVTEALKESGLHPAHLVLEITETSLMSQENAIVARLGALRDEGVRIAIDDFGTGYSSLGYLKRLPIDILKIDRSFVSCVTEGAEHSALAQAIIKLGRIFNLRTIAEGIETPEQADLLEEFGCRSGQGFLFWRPMEIAHLRSVVSVPDRMAMAPPPAPVVLPTAPEPAQPQTAATR